jgi:prepilin-type N-terminal cleavage/methylation domain-containing protein
MPERQRGFTMVEMVIVLSVVLILSTLGTFVLTVFLRSYRASADARQLQSLVSLARMRACSAFTRTRLNVNQTARSYGIQVFNKTTGNYDDEGGTYFLSPGVSLGYGSIGTPAGEQSAIGEPPTTGIQFNSRGIPVQDTTWSPTGDYAVYVTNSANDLFYAVTVSRTGLPTLWQYNTTTNHWESR